MNAMALHARRTRAVLTLARIAVAAAFALALLVPTRAAAAFKPPPLRGHIVDTSGQLSSQDIAYLDTRLETFRRRAGFAIVALVIPSLDGETIDDVAYTAFNAWGVGEAGKDNGVLIVIATGDRKVRIETGKGVGGALTDLQSNDIITGTMGPLLREGRLRDAIDMGAGAIADALVRGTASDARGGAGADRAPPPRAQPPSPLAIGGVAIGVVVVIVLLIVSPAFRSIFWFLLQMVLMSGGGGSGRSGGGGSGYSGGGGRSGGGGSSGDY